MGLFGRIFGGKSKVKSVASSASFLGAYREAGGQSYSGGGWGLDRFQSIIDAHSSIEDMVDEWELDDESCPYMSLDGYNNCYAQAYQEELDKAVAEADILNMLLAEFEGEEVDPEDLINMEAVDENAYEYACDLAEAWYNGQEWIPEEVMDWAWYDLSSHNY